MTEPAEARTRFLARCTAGELLRLLGWMGVFTACVLLAEPVADNLFALDGERLAPPVNSVLERFRLSAGVTGMVLLATGVYARRWVAKELPLRRGHAALALIVPLLCLTVLECALRLYEWRRWGSPFATPLPLSSIRREGELYHRPGLYVRPTGNDYQPSRRGVAFITVNRFGLRGPLPTLPRPAGRARIICLGGSTTFGFVSDGEDWPARLQAILSARGDIEVLNAGRPGSTTWSDFRYLRDRLLLLDPDVVILCEGFNDMWRAVRRHAGEQKDYGLVDERLPPGEEVLDLGEPRRWPVRISFAAYYLGRFLDSRLEASASPAVPSSPPDGFRFDPAIVSVYERNLTAMLRLCKARGVLPVVATFVGCDDPHRPEAEQRLRLRYVLEQVPPLDVRSSQKGIDLYRDLTRRVARAEGAPLVDLASLMTKDTSLYADTIHLTTEGENTLALLLARELERLPAFEARLREGRPAGPR